MYDQRVSGERVVSMKNPLDGRDLLVSAEEGFCPCCHRLFVNVSVQSLSWTQTEAVYVLGRGR